MDPLCLMYCLESHALLHSGTIASSGPGARLGGEGKATAKVGRYVVLAAAECTRSALLCRGAVVSTFTIHSSAACSSYDTLQVLPPQCARLWASFRSVSTRRRERKGEEGDKGWLCGVDATWKTGRRL